MGKTLRDIRFYASEESNSSGNGFPSDCARFIPYPKVLNWWGERIAQRLNADKFSLGDFDHLYVNFTSGVPDGEFRFSDRAPEKWMRYVDVGVNFNSLQEFSAKELEKFLIEKTFDSLLYLCNGDLQNSKLVGSLREDIRTYGSNIEIPVKSKSVSSYSITITYKLRPNDLESYGLIEFIDLKTGKSFKTRFLDLVGSEDIFFLVGSISVKNGYITIKPRSSFRAGLFTENYDIPIEIKISDHLNT